MCNPSSSFSGEYALQLQCGHCCVERLAMHRTPDPGGVGEVVVEERLPQLPTEVYTLVAQKLPVEDLPSTRLVSKNWYTATNRAVRSFGKNSFFAGSQLHTAIHKFPGLTSLDLTFLPLDKAPQYLKILTPLTSLQSISMYYTAAETSPAWALLQQQTCLTSFQAVSLEYAPAAGIQDSFLYKIADLQSLVSLNMSLSSLATDAGVRSLSCLTNLQSLRLPVSKYEACFSANSVSVVTVLSQLTFLSLAGWAVNDVHVKSLTCLTRLQHLDLSQCERLSCLCFMTLMDFPQLERVQIVRDDDWILDVILSMFQSLRPSVKLQL